MLIQRRWGFSLGTLFSLIVVYFIYLYSKDKEWALLALISKWYLIIAIGLIAVSLGIILLIIVFSLLMLLIAMVRSRGFNKRHKNKKFDGYVDAEYRIKE